MDRCCTEEEEEEEEEEGGLGRQLEAGMERCPELPPRQPLDGITDTLLASDLF